MELKSNIPQLIEHLEQVKAQMGGGAGNPPAIPDFSDAMFGALNSGAGLMKRRIFNLGEDAEGNRLGTYRKQYAKKRVKQGRQIAYKDLEVEGALRRSIETVKVDNAKVVIAIVNPQTALIAGYQEEQVGRLRGGGIAKIFTLSQAEYDQVQTEGRRAIQQVIKNLLQ